MIKLLTTRTQEYPGGGNEGWAGSFADAKHDSMVAHAYQEALGNATTLANVANNDKSEGAKFILNWLQKNAAELLKSWGVEP